MREVVVSGFKSLRRMKLTSKTKNVGEGRKYTKTRIGSIIGSRFMTNATRTIRWTILQIKHTVPFFHNKCPIFDRKQGKLICTPDNITGFFSHSSLLI